MCYRQAYTAPEGLPHSVINKAVSLQNEKKEKIHLKLIMITGFGQKHKDCLPVDGFKISEGLGTSSM
jgi:hypothetical protein